MLYEGDKIPVNYEGQRLDATVIRMVNDEYGMETYLIDLPIVIDTDEISITDVWTHKKWDGEEITDEGRYPIIRFKVKGSNIFRYNKSAKSLLETLKGEKK